MEKENGKSKKIKRVIALLGVIVLLAMYLILLVLSLMDFEGWERYFMACLAASVAIPILVWVNMFLYDRIIGKNKE